MSIIQKIKELADSIEESNNKTLFHSNSGFNLSSPNVNGIFNDIVLDEDKLLFFDNNPYIRNIKKKNWDSININ